jgi:hypothetical protein
MSEHGNRISSEQEKIISDADAAILQIIKDTQAKLVEAGAMERPGPGDLSCSACDCTKFMPSGEGAPAVCSTPRCGHSLTLHYVF